MTSYAEASRIKDIIDGSSKVVIIQADNPDGDSLASALALEQILADLGKDTWLYCGVDMPDYIKHLKGWDRVNKDIPSQFDASIIVDTSVTLLLDKLEHSEYRSWVASKPVIVIDHHAEAASDISYATVLLNDKISVSTGEVIYKLANQLGWELNVLAKSHIASSILADSLGLSSGATTPETYRIMADLIESGVDRPALEEARRSLTKMPEKIYRYKANLIKRTELYNDNSVALVTIPQSEITEYSPLYNPAPLIQNDMLQITNVKVAIVLKNYLNGKITGSIRCGYEAEVAAEIAKHFGGGGHAFAAGFKIESGKLIEDVKSECIKLANKLLNPNHKGSPSENL